MAGTVEGLYLPPQRPDWAFAIFAEQQAADGAIQVLREIVWPPRSTSYLEGTYTSPALIRGLKFPKYAVPDATAAAAAGAVVGASVVASEGVASEGVAAGDGNGVGAVGTQRAGFTGVAAAGASEGAGAGARSGVTAGATQNGGTTAATTGAGSGEGGNSEHAPNQIVSGPANPPVPAASAGMLKREREELGDLG